MEQNLVPMGQTPMMYTDPAAVAAAETAKAEVQAAFIMAMHRPRNVESARQEILKLCRKPDFADAVEYSKPMYAGQADGKKNIVGLSIRFAEQAMRLWGNVRTTQRVVYEDDKVRRVHVKVLDLESNAEFSREVSVAKTVERKNSKGREVLGQRPNSCGETVFIVKATEDEMAVKEASAIAKAIRNEGLRLLPYDIKDEAIRVSKETLSRQDAQDPDASIRKIIDSFAGLNVTVSDLESYLGHPVSKSSPSEINDMRAMYTAIKGGDAKWSDYIIDAEAEPSTSAKAAASLARKPKAETNPNPEPAFKVEEKAGSLATICPMTGTDSDPSDCRSCPEKPTCSVGKKVKA